MADDPITTRAHTVTPLTDGNDPPQFPLLLEAVKDAFVERLRTFFARDTITVARRSEVPTVRKYASGFDAGEDPYVTYGSIVQEFADQNERLPHVGVLTASGTTKSLTVGRPIIATVQASPRVTGTVAEPFALPSATHEVRTLTVSAVAASYTYAVAGVPFTTTGTFATVADAARAIAADLRGDPAVAQFVDVTSSGAVVTTTAVDAGRAFTLTGGAGLTAALVTAAGVATDGGLTVRTLVGGRTVVTSTFVFTPRQFATIGAATAQAVADALNPQSLYVDARASSGRLELRCKERTPNEIEVLPTADYTDVAVLLGLAVAGSAPVGSALTVNAAAGTATLTLASGTPFGTVVAGQYVTLAGWTDAANNGRFRVTAVTASSMTFTNAAAVAAVYGAGTAPTYFVGARDDWRNPARPVCRRYSGPSAELTVGLEIIAEDATVRRELVDLVWAFVDFLSEETHGVWYGRSVFDDARPGELIQVLLGRRSATSGGSDAQRPGDGKMPVYTDRVQVPVTATYYVDREVRVPSGPSAGLQYAVEGTNFTHDDGLPLPN